MRFDVEFFCSCFPALLLKIPYTLYLGLISFFFAFVLGMILEICYTSKNKVLRYIAGLYISYFRSTPYIWTSADLYIYERDAGKRDAGYFACNEFFGIYCRDDQRWFNVG